MKKIALLFALALPQLLFAQIQTGSFKEIVLSSVSSFLPPILSIVALIIFLYFVWRVAEFILHADNEKTRSSASRVFLWGIFALFVIASLIAIIAFVLSEFGFGEVVIPTLPTGN